MESLGGEGLMLRQPGSRYEVGRSATLLKVKQFQDAEALVIGHEPGSGRHKGRLGALLVELADGTRFAVGTGFTDAQRENPSSVGAIDPVSFPGAVRPGRATLPVLRRRLRGRRTIPHIQQWRNDHEHPVRHRARRRLEFSAGNSHKFWEISAHGSEATVRFGRIGTPGQVNVKTFADQAAAAKHVEKMIRAKLGKGYREVA